MIDIGDMAALFYKEKKVMRHKHADLLIYAAENADAEFISDCHESAYPISFVLITPQFDWRIKPNPVKKWHFVYQIFGSNKWHISHSLFVSAEAFKECTGLRLINNITKLEFTEIEVEE